jgi:parallel beta-helix repeat protein
MKITNSGTVLDLDGKTLRDSVTIQGPVRDVVIRNGTIKGEIRLRPDRIDGQTTPGHTERIQAAAPTSITVRNIKFDTDGSTHQAYFGPGATGCRLINCEFKGQSAGPSVYFSPEGGDHLVRGCTFSARTGGRREVLSIDGSAGNLIARNTFQQVRWGGIYVYRNCGENGRVRHQKPKRNTISDNSFNLRRMRPVRLSDGSGHQASLLFVPYGIILGSRQGDSTYCDLDSEHQIGSGLSDLDYANFNVVEGNTFSGDWLGRHIWDNDENNVVRN